MSKPVDIYGEFVVGPPGSVPSVHMDEFMGFRVGRSSEGRIAGVDLHFRSRGQVQSLTIPMPQAMAMLAYLKSLQLNEDVPFPEDPRDPTWTASQYKSKKKP